MSGVNLENVKLLREKFGLGLVDCKKALEEAKGDMSLAADNLRKRGVSVANKKAGRETPEGAFVFLHDKNNKKLVFFRIGCETDFVANNNKFSEIINFVSDFVLENNSKDLESITQNESFLKIFTEKTIPLGEAIALTSFKCVNNVENDCFSFYVHNSLKNSKNAGKSISFITTDNPISNDNLRDGFKKICMHILALNPIALSKEKIDPAILVKETEIYRCQFASSGKPENVVEKIILGKIDSFVKESCLLEQNLAMDQNIKVSEYINQLNKENNTSIKIKDFSLLS